MISTHLRFHSLASLVDIGNVSYQMGVSTGERSKKTKTLTVRVSGRYGMIPSFLSETGGFVTALSPRVNRWPSLELLASDQVSKSLNQLLLSVVHLLLEQ